MVGRHEPSISFNKDKFLDVVHYIVEANKNNMELLGRTKMHKCLYYADMLHYLDKGEPLTGARYLKYPYGPVARHLNWALETLQNFGKISVSRRPYFGLVKYDFELLQSLSSNLISDDEKKLLDEVILFVCRMSAKEISEISHAQPWQSAEMGSEIPYSSAYLLLPQPIASSIEG